MKLFFLKDVNFKYVFIAKELNCLIAMKYHTKTYTTPFFLKDVWLYYFTFYDVSCHNVPDSHNTVLTVLVILNSFLWLNSDYIFNRN